MTDPVFSAFDADVEFLCRLLRRSPPGDAVEVGCLLGHTSVRLAAACAETGRRLVCIDPWDGSSDSSGEETYRGFLRTVAGAADTIDVVRCRAERWTPDRPLGFAFVDGSHYSPHPYIDLVTMWPAVVPGGVVAIHDSRDAGWGPNVRGSVEWFAEERGLTVRESVYHPTPAEQRSRRHGVSGVMYLTKPVR